MEEVGNSWKGANMKDFLIVDDIDDELEKFNFTTGTISYEYLIDSIYIVTKDKLAVRDFKARVYEPIARKYDTRAENVQWCLNKLINSMTYNTSAITISSYFGININQKVSTKTFIVGVARKLRRKTLKNRQFC